MLTRARAQALGADGLTAGSPGWHPSESLKEAGWTKRLPAAGLAKPVAGLAEVGLADNYFLRTRYRARQPASWESD